MINIGEHKDYTLKQKVVMLQGTRITGYGLKESIKLTEDDQRQLFEWFKQNKPEFLKSAICIDKFCPDCEGYNEFGNRR
jgi:hypothetical protein